MSKNTNDPSGLPAHRFNKFFDSRGPGGKMAPPQQQSTSTCTAPKLIEVPANNIIQYAHNGYVYCLTIVRTGSGGEQLVSGGGDGAVKLWSFTNPLKEPVLLHTFETNHSIMSFVNADSFLYAGLAAGIVKIWDLETLQLVRSNHPDEDDLSKNFSTADTLTLAIHHHSLFKGSKRGLEQWNFQGRQTKVISASAPSSSPWISHGGKTVLSTVIINSPQATYLIAGGNDSDLVMWDITESNPDTFHDTELTTRRPAEASLSNEQLLRSLAEFVTFRTISSQPDRFFGDCRRCATFLRELLQSYGAQAKLIPLANTSSGEGRNPIVYGKFVANKVSDIPTKTIIFYGHYDVIFADETDNDWVTGQPFTMTALDGYMYARGVSDNKGPILAAIFAAAELHRERALTTNVVFLIEGEEECGSGGFQTAICENKEFLDIDDSTVDGIILSNSYWIDEDNPCLNYGLRGIINVNVKIFSDGPDLHSGVNGGLAREPTIDLIHLLSKLTTENENDNDQGGSAATKILIPNFYDKVLKTDQAERDEYDEIIKRVVNNSATLNSQSFHLNRERLMAMWRLPSLTIHRINVSGPPAGTNLTIIPKSASAAVSLRIVPNQSIEQIKHNLVIYLTECFEGFHSDNHIEITFSSQQSEPWLGDRHNHLYRRLSHAIKRQWNKDPLFIREGGSIPAVRFLEKSFDAPAVQFPCGQSSDNAHLGNERLRISNLFKAREIMKQFFMA
ncbi:Zn-dependent exopeptidase [Nadsonia fulvescens var. elongata DSM 6958]|uniref:Zn-dependent exopeptidase n=1 Tax=Nadsonia fulvescens var. elongata DSM 6958 TaxID=857566 RepID=A0A1E3PD86_9ASCO|nr:Zn-dependent exopeptidase [Nadsonia fulvescens var. elongata DSM 6958]